MSTEFIVMLLLCSSGFIVLYHMYAKLFAAFAQIHKRLAEEELHSESFYAFMSNCMQHKEDYKISEKLDVLVKAAGAEPMKEKMFTEEDADYGQR